MILVAVLLTGMFAMAALVIDVGALLQERRELQNGADAGALAIAQACAEGECGDYVATATELARANAGDDAATVDSVTFPGSRTVTVVTSTETGDGKTILPYAFANLLVGEKGQKVHAAATAGWGSPQKATTFRLTISECEWNALTQGGTVYEQQTEMRFHGEDPTHDCTAGTHDADSDGKLSGGFGWLDGTGCTTDLSAAQWTGEKPGNSVPGGCKLVDLYQTTQLVPIFDDTNNLNGNNGKYHIVGFGAFHITGYRFPGQSIGDATCTGNETCMSGYFTTYYVTTGTPGGPTFGAIVVGLSE